MSILSHILLISVWLLTQSSIHTFQFTLFKILSCQSNYGLGGYFFIFTMFYSFYLIAGDEPADYYLSDMFGQLSAVVASKPSERINIQEG